MSWAYARHLDAFSAKVFNRAPDMALCEELAVSALLSLIAREFISISSLRSKNRCGDLAARAIEFIEDNLSGAVTLDGIAAALNASLFSVIQAIERQTGLTPTQFILQRRVDRARKRLLDGMSIAEAAYGSGFAHQAHFCRELKKRWGDTPNLLAYYTPYCVRHGFIRIPLGLLAGRRHAPKCGLLRRAHVHRSMPPNLLHHSSLREAALMAQALHAHRGVRLAERPDHLS